MAITVEFGKCAQCSENNPKQLQACRKCNAPLPWAKMAKPKITKAPAKTYASQSPAINKPAAQLDWGILGVSLICFMMPIIGYFLYRSYEENSNSKAGIALTASILGVVAHIMRAVVSRAG